VAKTFGLAVRATFPPTGLGNALFNTSGHESVNRVAVLDLVSARRLPFRQKLIGELNPFICAIYSNQKVAFRTPRKQNCKYLHIRWGSIFPTRVIRPTLATDHPFLHRTNRKWRVHPEIIPETRHPECLMLPASYAADSVVSSTWSPLTVTFRCVVTSR
jgi:hypothetical protein